MTHSFPPRRSSDFVVEPIHPFKGGDLDGLDAAPRPAPVDDLGLVEADDRLREGIVPRVKPEGRLRNRRRCPRTARCRPRPGARSEEHTSELQSLMRISYAVFCLKKKTKKSR